MPFNFSILSFAVARIAIAIFFFLVAGEPKPGSVGRIFRRINVALASYVVLALIECALRSIDGSDIYLSANKLFLAALSTGALLYVVSVFIFGWQQVRTRRILFAVILPLACLQLLSDVNRGLDFAPIVYVERLPASKKRFDFYYKGRLTQDVLLFEGNVEHAGFTLPERLSVESTTANHSGRGVGIEISPGFLGWPWYRSILPLKDAQLRRSPKATLPIDEALKTKWHEECLEGGLRPSCELLLNSRKELHLSDDSLHLYETQACKKGMLYHCEQVDLRESSDREKERVAEAEKRRKREDEIAKDPHLRKLALKTRIEKEKALGNDPLLSPGEAADYLGLSSRFILERIAAHEFGELPHGGDKKIPKSFLDQWRDRNRDRIQFTDF